MLNTRIIRKTTIILMMFVKISFPTLVGKCNQCFVSNKVACVDETHFSTCFQGLPTTTITKCPDDHFCTNDELICQSSAEGYVPACYNDYCSDCEVTNGIFTCLDETTYGYCFGAKTPLEGAIRKCPTHYVCNFDVREVCVSEITHEPSCKLGSISTTETIKITTENSTLLIDSTIDDTTTTTILTPESTTTPIIEIDPTTTDQTTKSTIVSTVDSTIDDTTKTLIRTESTAVDESTTTPIIEIDPTTTDQTTESQEPQSAIETTTKETTDGKYTNTFASTTTAAPRNPNTICREIGEPGFFKSDDRTCRAYIYCYPLSGQYLGWIYYCDGYFNAARRVCQKERPPNCATY